MRTGFSCSSEVQVPVSVNTFCMLAAAHAMSKSPFATPAGALITNDVTLPVDAAVLAERKPGEVRVTAKAVLVASARHTVSATYAPVKPVADGVSVPAVLSHNNTPADNAVVALAVTLTLDVHVAGAAIVVVTLLDALSPPTSATHISVLPTFCNVGNGADVAVAENAFVSALAQNRIGLV